MQSEIQFLKGADLDRRMNELAEIANSNHRRIDQAWQGMLEYAKVAGEALIEAKKRKGGRGKWTRWLTTNFESSRETARVYMRVARKWDHPRAREARAKGIVPSSIQAFLNIIKGRPLVRKLSDDDNGEIGDKPTKEQMMDMLRQDLRTAFARDLKSLTLFRLRAFERDYDKISERLFEDVRRCACNWTPEYPVVPMTEEEEAEDAKWWRDLSRTFNRKRKNRQNAGKV